MSNFRPKFLLMLLALTAVACSERKPPEPSAGELVFIKNCKVCHAQGLNGAPILGNRAMWKDRITQGIPVLVEHATNGYGLMPAKGGNVELPDSEVIKAVEYMASKVK